MVYSQNFYDEYSPIYYDVPGQNTDEDAGALLRDYSQRSRGEVFTLEQLCYRLGLRAMVDNTSTRNQTLLCRAVQDALRVAPSKHDWSYYRRQARFTASPSSTIAVTYDHTGGTYARQMTITDANTWPSDATFGEIRIGEALYRVDRRISDTVITLEAPFAPSEDYAGDVVWERRAYTLSLDIAKVHYMQNVTYDRPLLYLPIDAFQHNLQYGLSDGRHEYFTFQNHRNYFGKTELILLPAPTETSVFEVSAVTSPLIPNVREISGTDGVGASGEYSFSSAAAGFTRKSIGTILRIGYSSTIPKEDNGDDWAFEAFVTGITSGGTVTISEPIPNTMSGRGFIMSSPIDIDPSVMLEYVEDEAYFQYTKNHDHKSIKTTRELAHASLIQAMGRDKKVSLNSRLTQQVGSGRQLASRYYTIGTIAD